MEGGSHDCTPLLLLLVGEDAVLGLPLLDASTPGLQSEAVERRLGDSFDDADQGPRC
jgi:hypothetical protein